MFIQPSMLAGLLDFYLGGKKKRQCKKEVFLSECALKSLSPVFSRVMCKVG